MKYREKIPLVEAYQVTGSEDEATYPDWLNAAIKLGIIRRQRLTFKEKDNCLFVVMASRKEAKEYSWIVNYGEGNFSAHSNEDFLKQYEPVPDPFDITKITIYCSSCSKPLK